MIHAIRHILILFAVSLIVGCTPPRDTIILITATPPPQVAVEISGGSEPIVEASEPDAIPTATPNPTSAPTPTFIPTPNPTRAVVVDLTQDQVHVVQPGDTLALIALSYGIALESLLTANNFASDSEIIYPGQTLIVPQAVQVTGSSFKIIPDSELVYGPSVHGFDVETYLQTYFPASFLANYTEELDGRLWSGSEIIDRVALEQSINPRLLLALLEFETQWISRAMITPDEALYPFNYVERPGQIFGLYRQLDWAAKMLQTGYYGWRQRGMTAALLADGARIALDPTINGGTAGVEVLLAQTRTYDEWQAAAHHTGVFSTFVGLFGDPFSYAVEPLLPPDLTQPEMVFPWPEGETWYFTGGPHGAWGSGSAWGALDFVGGDLEVGCDPSPYLARAVADGVIARNEYGIVVLDLDGDGFEGTGWTVFYLHLTSEDRRVEVGQEVKAGDPIGHPACEAGVSYSTHLHIARRYNGEWIAADCTACMLDAPAPQWNFGGWLVYSYDSEYDGYMLKGDEYREACVCREPLNTLTGPFGD